MDTFPGSRVSRLTRSCTRRQQVYYCSCLKLDPPPIQCAARVNSLLTEQSSYNLNSVILFSTFTCLTAYSWQRVQFGTNTLAHLLASCVKCDTREPGKVSTVYTGCGLCCEDGPSLDHWASFVMQKDKLAMNIFKYSYWMIIYLSTNENIPYKFVLLFIVFCYVNKKPRWLQARF